MLQLWAFNSCFFGCRMETTCWCWQRREATMRPVKPLLMDTVWASLFSPQNFGKDVHPFWQTYSKWVGSTHHMNSGLFSVVAPVRPNGKGSAFAYFQPNMAQVCRYLLRSSCLVCAGLRGAMLKAAVDAGRRAFNQSGCKVCKASNQIFFTSFPGSRP